MSTSLDEALAIVEAAGYRVTKTRAAKSKNKVPLGLNAIGKPFSPQYDPNYRMGHKPSYGHLRIPYPTTMRFVGDPPNYDPNTRSFRDDPPRDQSTSTNQRSVT